MFSMNCSMGEDALVLAEPDLLGSCKPRPEHGHPRHALAAVRRLGRRSWARLLVHDELLEHEEDLMLGPRHVFVAEDGLVASVSSRCFSRLSLFSLFLT